jgi:hypothetical protein
MSLVTMLAKRLVELDGRDGARPSIPPSIDRRELERAILAELERTAEPLPPPPAPRTARERLNLAIRTAGRIWTSDLAIEQRLRLVAAAERCAPTYDEVDAEDRELDRRALPLFAHDRRSPAEVRASLIRKLETKEPFGAERSLELARELRALPGRGRVRVPPPNTQEISR